MSTKALGICVACAISFGSVDATPAMAAPTLMLTTGADPAESITTQLQASGTATSGQTALSATIKPTGGRGCGANFAADDSDGEGSSVFDFQGVNEGPFSKSLNHTFTSAGSYLLCGWLNDGAQSGDPVVASASLTVTVRPPRLTLSVSAPATVQPGQTFQVVTTAQAETDRTVTEYLLPNTGRGCPTNGNAAGSTSGETSIYWAGGVLMWNVNGGPFSEARNETIRSAGQYVACAYVQYPSDQSSPEASASAIITAVSLPPPCVVPTFASTTKLSTIKRAIRAAGCAVGKIRHTASRKTRSGYVSGLSPSPGLHLPAGTAVNVTVSTGPPCIVPHIHAGTKLGIAELRLRAAHCTVGQIRATRSGHYRRGRVLSLGARPGQVLQSYAPVEIVISGGRRHRR